MENLEKLLQQVQDLNEKEKFKSVIQLLPDNILNQYKSSDLYAEKAQALNRENLNLDSEICAKIALELNPNNFKAFHYLGNIFKNNKNEAKAIEFYLKALEINPKYARSYNGLGNVFYDKKEYDKAIESYNKAIDIDTKYAHSYNGLGNVFRNLKNYDKAIKNYKIAIDIDTTLLHSYTGLGKVFYDKKEYDKAIESYNKAIDIDPKHAPSYIGLGNVFRNLKNYDKAIENYNIAIDIDPTLFHSYAGLGNVFYDKKDYDKTIEYYTQAIKFNSNEKRLFTSRAYAYYLLNKFDLALKDYETYISLEKEKDFNYDFVVSRIDEIKKLTNDPSLKKINKIVDSVKELLLFKEECITHYTSLSVANILILGRTEKVNLEFENKKQKELEPNSFRLSEGAYLNDTSEGTELLNYLSLKNNLSNLQTRFSEMPFIGSFVSSDKFDDLKSWRMYGKEKNEEAKGCALTFSIESLRSSVMDKLNTPPNTDNNSFDFTFYKVAYIDNNAKGFNIPNQEKDNKKLKTLIDELRTEFEKSAKNKTKKPKEFIDAMEKINEIVFLFKSAEYSYENEVRLVKIPIGFKTHIDKTQSIPKVYIELAPIHSSLRKITIGPKVERADEWAAAFHYELKNSGHNDCEIFLSNLPFK